MLNKFLGLLNRRNGEYKVVFQNGVPRVIDALDRPVEDNVAKMIGQYLAHQYDGECFVYVGEKDDFIKIGQSADLARRDNEHVRTSEMKSYRRRLQIKCQNRNEALLLEGVICEFLTSMDLLVDGKETFFKRDHDLSLLNAVFHTTDPRQAVNLFRAAKNEYCHLKEYSKNNAQEQFGLIEYIERNSTSLFSISAFRQHALVEFGFLPRK